MGTRPGPMIKHRPDMEWFTEAKCRTINNFLDDPDHGGYTDRQRKQICNGYEEDGQEVEPQCPVINECLAYALSQPIADIAHRGLVYGGYTGLQIKKKIQQNRREGHL